jgi:hypothetical protein
MDRQRADITTGKEQRRDDIAVRRHHHPARRNLEHCLIVPLRQQRVGESVEEQLINELSHSLATAPVAHVDPAILQVELAGMGAAFGHLVTCRK